MRVIPLPHMKQLTFWHYQISGWMMFFVVHCIRAVTFKGKVSLSILWMLIEAVSGFLLTVALRSLYRRTNIQNVSIVALLTRLVLYSFVCTVIWHLFSISLSYVFYGPVVAEKYFTYQSILQSIAFMFPVPFGWSTLYFGIKFWKEWELQKETTEKASAAGQQAQLQMLRYQLNPHFLFNALNSIRALMDESAEEARTLITELSEFLRYSLISKNNTVVPLKDELTAIQNYLAVEQKRYEQNLKVSFDIAPAAENFPILSFLIHPLVENAVRYGMQTSHMPLRLTIRATAEEEQLRLWVINSGSWLNENDVTTYPHEKYGAGLENVRKRLEHAFPGRYSLGTFEKDGYVHILLHIHNGAHSDHEEKIPGDRR